MLSPAGARVASYVQSVSMEHPGGKEYFYRLDHLVGHDPLILGELTELAQEKFGTGISIVVSGGFGIQYRDFARANRLAPPALWLPGGLRYSQGPAWYAAKEARSRLIGSYFDCVFIDDSLYQGRTQQYVRELVLTAGRRFVGTVVAYDGSRTQQPDVHSLYRYFDHFLPE